MEILNWKECSGFYLNTFEHIFEKALNSYKDIKNPSSTLTPTITVPFFIYSHVLLMLVHIGFVGICHISII